MAVPYTMKPATELVNEFHSVEQLGGRLNVTETQPTALRKRFALQVSDQRIRKQLQLAGLRFVCTRARWLESEATQIGIALKSGAITSDEADERIDELGALDLVYPELMGTE